ncbi:MAG: FAD-binding oxidoreductase [Lysobacter sp.]|nr:FAD-binding oxidoreductase [Lysobacter sp.]
MAGAQVGCTSPDDVRDVSGLDPVRARAIARPSTTAQVQALLARSDAPVSIGGGHFSMGDQVAAPDATHLDMRALRRVLFVDREGMRARVQAGATWRDLQDRLDSHDLSVKVMQSYSNFTVGGSVSVNCHGRYVGLGPVANTVRALQLVTADARVLELSRTSHPELFAAVVGGYGGLGIVTEVELDLARNEPLERRAERVALDEYPAFFREHVLGDRDIVLHNADLAPPRFDAPVSVSWRRTRAPLTDARRLVPRNDGYGRDRALIWAASELPNGDKVRERYLTDKLLHEPAVVMRNLQASLDAASLEPWSRRFTTYLLQEYFVPVPAFASFARDLAKILVDADANALNVSIRHAPADTTSLLRWAPSEVFCFVVWHKQWSTRGADATTGAWARKLIDAALAHGGRHYLPYRLHATPAQFARGYPARDAYLALKREADPGRRFRSVFLDKYLADERRA